MKIVIKDVAELGDQLRIEFECECGHGLGVWSGPPPRPGDERFVELEIQDAVAVDKELKFTDAPLGMRLENGGQVMVGEVAEVGDNGYARLDLGCGRVDVAVQGDPPVLHRRYELSIPKLQLIDCSY